MLWAALLFSEAGGEVGTCCLRAVSPAVKTDASVISVDLRRNVSPTSFSLAFYLVFFSITSRSGKPRLTGGPCTLRVLLLFCFVIVFISQ